MVLPEPVAPTSATRLARRDVEVDVAQHRARRSVGEGEVDVLEAQVAARAARCTPVAGDDVGLGVEDLEDPGGRGHRLLGHREDHAERGDRPDQRQHQGDERDQLAGGERALADADRAEQQHDDDGEVGDHLEEGPEPRRQPDLVHAGVVQRRGRRRRTAPATWSAAAEGLDHPDADGALLGQRGEVALLVLDPAGDHDVAPSRSASTSQTIGDGGGGDDEAERPVHVQQHQRSSRRPGGC